MWIGAEPHVEGRNMKTMEALPRAFKRLLGAWKDTLAGKEAPGRDLERNRGAFQGPLISGEEAECEEAGLSKPGMLGRGMKHS